MRLSSTTQAPTLVGSWEAIAATAAVFIIAIRYRFSPDIPIGFLLAGCLLPVTLSHLARYRGATVITGLCFLSAVSGLLLTLGHSYLGNVSASLTLVQTARVVGLSLVLATLLWARSILGVRRLTLTFGLGSLASLVVSGVNLDNVWKFSFSVPTILILLSLPSVAKNRWFQMVMALTLVLVSALNDSRSAAGLLLIAAALTVTQRKSQHPDHGNKWRSWVALGRIALVGLGAFVIVQAAILEGMLGEVARTRTEGQISQSGSSLVGGRPEMGAALALIFDRPWGYGAGTLATYENIMLGKSGMYSLGYDPNNGYVEEYMFGFGIEVHSLLGDLWILYGFAGAALAVTIVSFALFGLGDSLSRGTATAIGTFIILRLTWDFAFSPYASAMFWLPLTLAVALPAIRSAVAPRRALPPDSG